MKDKLDILFKNDNNLKEIAEESNAILSDAKRKINGICRSIMIEANVYDPKRTIDSIQRYIDNKNKIKIDRILYSEISSFVFGLDTQERGKFLTNIDKLLSYAYDKEKNVGEDCRRIVVKIYDHFQLVSCQIESANNIFTNSVEDTKINLRNEVKGIEKEHISILGIFASIVLAFVGGITFSTSVLQNIGSVSIYRLLLVIDLLAFVLINTIFILVRFIFEINDKDVSIFKISWVNGAVIAFAVIIVVCWIIQIDKAPGFIVEMLPWG